MEVVKMKDSDDGLVAYVGRWPRMKRYLTSSSLFLSDKSLFRKDEAVSALSPNIYKAIIGGRISNGWWDGKMQGDSGECGGRVGCVNCRRSLVRGTRVRCNDVRLLCAWGSNCGGQTR